MNPERAYRPEMPRADFQTIMNNLDRAQQSSRELPGGVRESVNGPVPARTIEGREVSPSLRQFTFKLWQAKDTEKHPGVAITWDGGLAPFDLAPEDRVFDTVEDAMAWINAQAQE